MVHIIRTTIMFTAVIVIMRFMGKRQIGQLQPYELVIAMMISDLASIPLQDNSISLINGFLPILTLMVLQILISFLIIVIFTDIIISFFLLPVNPVCIILCILIAPVHYMLFSPEVFACYNIVSVTVEERRPLYRDEPASQDISGVCVNRRKRQLGLNESVSQI